MTGRGGLLFEQVREEAEALARAARMQQQEQSRPPVPQDWAPSVGDSVTVLSMIGGSATGRVQDISKGTATVKVINRLEV